MKKHIFSLPGILVGIVFLCTATFAQTVTVINMVPNALSNETSQDSEPDIAVNPNDPQEIVATAFTSNPSGSTATAPFYISVDGGATWVLNNIVPSDFGGTHDITVSLSRNNILYAGILRDGFSDPTRMQVLRTNNLAGALPMDILLSRDDVDQPYIRALSSQGGPTRNQDHVFSGNNDFNAASNRTASFDFSNNAATAAAPAGFSTIRIETRNPFNQDGPPIRPAIHPNGTVYAVFVRRTSSSGSTRTGDVVVVRDDNWGLGATAFNDLTDPGDGLAGRMVVTGVSWSWSSPGLGQERVGDRAAIAVDPRDSRTVYISYVAHPAGSTNHTLHVRRSTDSGNNWSVDMVTAADAINPQLAVNIRGDVAFFYQSLTGVAPNQRWESHLRISFDGGTNWNDLTLANTPASTPVRTFYPYLGDYAGLTAVGKDFYGVFSANNTPNNANFPQGVTYQRNANFTTNHLRNLAGTSNVNVSIDPFFFMWQPLPDDQDFYVRDWTNSTTERDEGTEPSTDPVFYTTSDIWNMRSNSPGSFNTNDQPQSQDPQVSSLGDNYAFARVHRKGTGSAETVSLHFLKSEFGTGSNYVDAGSAADPTLNFAAGEDTKTMTSGYQWTLVAITSSHTCLAVEIDNTNDPMVAPSLLGSAPGWPTTDLMVINDNNKAQRNMGVYNVADDGGSLSYYGIIHNAATYTRDISLYVEPEPRFNELFKEPELKVIGGSYKQEGQIIKLPGMRPGENRWIELNVHAPGLADEQKIAITYNELVNNTIVNGFSIALNPTIREKAIVDNLYLYADVFYRIGNIFDVKDAISASRELSDLLRDNKILMKSYPVWMKDKIELTEKVTRDILSQQKEQDPFGVIPMMEEMKSAIKIKNMKQLMHSHIAYCHKMDAWLTMIEKSTGDVADILQNVNWQIELYQKVKQLQEVRYSKMILERSMDFSRDYPVRKVLADDYPALIEKIMPGLTETAERLRGQGVDLYPEINAMNDNLSAPKLLQKAHRDFLLKLEMLRF